MTDLKSELTIAKHLAKEAGNVILKVYRTAFAVEEKPGDQGPVTDADRGANDVILAGIRAEFPNDDIVSEEAVAERKSAARSTGRCWFVDPLDGTRDFVHRNDEFAVHIGLAINGIACLGVVYAPVTGKLFSGIVGTGATLEESGRIRALHVPTEEQGSSLRMVVSRSHRLPATEEIRKALDATAVAQGSVGLKCALLVEGLADLYVYPSGGTSRWDTCAPEAVLHAAGGLLVDVTGAAYRYDGAEVKNPRGIVAGSPELVARVLPTVTRICQSAGVVP